MLQFFQCQSLYYISKESRVISLSRSLQFCKISHIFYAILFSNFLCIFLLEDFTNKFIQINPNTIYNMDIDILTIFLTLFLQRITILLICLNLF